MSAEYKNHVKFQAIQGFYEGTTLEREVALNTEKANIGILELGLKKLNPHEFIGCVLIPTQQSKSTHQKLLELGFVLDKISHNKKKGNALLQYVRIPPTIPWSVSEDGNTIEIHPSV